MDLYLPTGRQHDTLLFYFVVLSIKYRQKYLAKGSLSMKLMQIRIVFFWLSFILFMLLPETDFSQIVERSVID